MQLLCKTSYSQSLFPIQDEEDSFVIKAIIHAINDDNVPGLKHLLGSLTSYDINQPNKESLLGFNPNRTTAKTSSIDQLISVSVSTLYDVGVIFHAVC
ncbi:death-associated protein kinase 1 [Tachysurus ichikawai]